MEKKLNDIFGFLIFLQFFVSVINLCTSGFYLTKVNASGAYFWFSVMILGCFIFQIFTHCYFGEEMTRKVNNFYFKLITHISNDSITKHYQTEFAEFVYCWWNIPNGLEHIKYTNKAKIDNNNDENQPSDSANWLFSCCLINRNIF